MCGGASKLSVQDLNLPTDIEESLLRHGLSTAQAVIDEGAQGLAAIGLSEIDIAGVSEMIHRETGRWVD